MVSFIQSFQDPFENHGGFNDIFNVMSKRGGVRVTQNDAFRLIKQVLAKAEHGITSEDLAVSAKNVVAVIDTVLGPHLSQLNPDDVRHLIEQNSAQFGAQTALSALFDDPMTYEGEKMAAALKLWESLVEKAEEQQEAGQSTIVTLGAMRKTAEAINTIVRDTMSLVSDMLSFPDNDKQGSGSRRRAVVKRGWSVGVNVGHGSHSGTSVGLDFGFSF